MIKQMTMIKNNKTIRKKNKAKKMKQIKVNNNKNNN